MSVNSNKADIVEKKWNNPISQLIADILDSFKSNKKKFERVEYTDENYYSPKPKSFIQEWF